MSDSFYHSVLNESVMSKKTSFVEPNLNHEVLSETVMSTKNSFTVLT